jgi:hypothetical protein
MKSLSKVNLTTFSAIDSWFYRENENLWTSKESRDNEFIKIAVTRVKSKEWSAKAFNKF